MDRGSVPWSAVGMVAPTDLADRAIDVVGLTSERGRPRGRSVRRRVAAVAVVLARDLEAPGARLLDEIA